MTKEVSRRTLAVGAAWAAPAVAVAASAPGVAASPVDCLKWSLTATACKRPGSQEGWAYRLSFKVCNECPTPVSIQIGAIWNNSGKELTQCAGGLIGSTVTIPASPACVETVVADFWQPGSGSSAAFLIIRDLQGNQIGEVKAPPKSAECKDPICTS